MSLRPDGLFQASFWVAFRGCYFELTNGGRQCWGLIAESYQTPTGKEKEFERERKSGTKSKANSYVKSCPLGGAHAGLFIGEVKGLITMP
jgi:hypothetical protein